MKLLSTHYGVKVVGDGRITDGFYTGVANDLADLAIALIKDDTEEKLDRHSARE